ncbi:MAG: hypothetical protein AB7E55_17220, partial [Pigmentiphaga sp.]
MMSDSTLKGGASSRLGAMLREAAAPGAVLLAFFLIWQLAVMAFEVRPFVLPSPVLVASTFMNNFDQIAQAAGVTAVSFVGGFLVAAFFGLAFAVLII